MRYYSRVSETFLRARSAAAKEQRRQDLLGSAREQAAARGVRGLTLTSIADRAGVHISAVRRYFSSREEILLVLAAEQWIAFADEVEARLRNGTVDDVAEVLVNAMLRQPLFCDLLAHAAIDLERAVMEDVVAVYKLAAVDAVERAGKCLERSLNALPSGLGREAIADITALGAVLWQYANPSPELAALYERDPRLATAHIELAPRLLRATTALLGGFVARDR